MAVPDAIQGKDYGEESVTIGSERLAAEIPNCSGTSTLATLRACLLPPPVRGPPRGGRDPVLSGRV